MVPEVFIGMARQQVVHQRRRARTAVDTVQPAQQRIVGRYRVASPTGLV